LERHRAHPAPVREGAVRVDAIGHIPAVLRELGLDPDAVLAATGLDPRAFDDPLSEIPMASLGRLLASAAAASGCRHVGLLVGERSGTASLGVVGLLVRHSPDVGTALRNLSIHLHLRDRGAVASLQVDSGVAMFGYEISETGVEGVDQICDGAMAIAVNIVRELCSRAWRPSEVLFAHRAPADLRPFRRVFGARLRFDAERTALVFPAKWLAQPSQGADRQHFRDVSARVDALEISSGDDLVPRLRRELRMSLLAGKGSVGEVAHGLSMHRRTLNRRLRAHGTSVHRLVEDVRFEIARQLVENTRMPLTEIAAVLGYADASAFTRAFRRWTGRVPSGWRRAHAAPGRPVPAAGRGLHG
jgi:AraC-like DNA-binding protein